MLLWVSDLFDRTAGFIAGLVYMAAPYTLIDAMTRANQPEVLALALLPLILWAFRRLMIHGRRRDFALAVFTYAALLLTHNISSLIFTPILLAYLRGAWCVFRVQHASRTTQHVLRNDHGVRLDRLLLAARVSRGQRRADCISRIPHAATTITSTSSSLSEVLGGPGTSDPLLLNPPLRIILGWPQIALAVLGLVAIRKLQTREQRAHVIAGAVLLIGLLFMALPVSVGVWDNLPLIRFVQFPWRFVGRALLPAALLGWGRDLCTVNSLVTRYCDHATRSHPVRRGWPCRL